jgi:hypothetical protein
MGREDWKTLAFSRQPEPECSESMDVTLCSQTAAFHFIFKFGTAFRSVFKGATGNEELSVVVHTLAMWI